MRTIATTFAFLLSIIAPILAQEIVVSGVILDDNSQPIKGARIMMNTERAISNNEGLFSITCHQLPAKLTAFHANYQPHEQIVSRSQMDTATTIQLIIRLEEKSTSLEEVTITSTDLSWVYARKQTHIIDFNLRQNGMMLLCKELKNYYLRLVNDFDETLIELEIPDRPLTLFRDCMDNFHLVYEDVTYQIIETIDSFYLMEPVGRKNLQQLLEPCVYNAQQYFVFQKFGQYNQSVSFTLIDTLEQNSIELYAVDNVDYTSSLDEFAETQRAVLNSGNVMGENTPDFQRSLRRAADNLYFAETALSRPIYIPILEIADTVKLFDHHTNKVIVYNDSIQQERNFPIDYHLQKTWNYQLHVDQSNTQIYANYDNIGRASLVELNPSTGEKLQQTTINEHLYPEKIQVCGNYVYYLHHIFGDNSINYIYKQRLK